MRTRPPRPRMAPAGKRHAYRVSEPLDPGVAHKWTISLKKNRNQAIRCLRCYQKQASVMTPPECPGTPRLPVTLPTPIFESASA